MKRTGKRQDTNSAESSNILNKGLLQIVQAGYIETNLSFQSIIRKLTESTLCISLHGKENGNTTVTIKDEFCNCFFAAADDSDEEPTSNSKKLLNKATTVFLSNIISEEKKGIGVDLTNDYLETVIRYLDSHIVFLNSFSQYGALSALEHKSFLLPPVLSATTDQICAILFELTVFANGQFVITASTELLDYPLDSLANRSYNYVLPSALLPFCTEEEHKNTWGYYDIKDSITITKATAVIAQSIEYCFKCKVRLSKESHSILYIFDWSFLPNDFDKDDYSDDYKLAIYKLLCAPISDANIRAKKIRDRLFDDALYKFTRLIDVYSSTIYRTIVAVGRERAGIVQAILQENNQEGGDELTEAEVFEVTKNSIVGSVLPAIQIEMLNAYELERISISCNGLNTQTISSLQRLKATVYQAKMEHLQSNRFCFDSLRDLIDFFYERHKRKASEEETAKLVEQLEKTVEFRESLSAQRRSRWVSFILTIFALIGSLGEIITVASYANEGFRWFAVDVEKQRLFVISLLIWLALNLVIIIGLVFLRIMRKKWY